LTDLDFVTFRLGAPVPADIEPFERHELLKWAGTVEAPLHAIQGARIRDL